MWKKTLYLETGSGLDRPPLASERPLVAADFGVMGDISYLHQVLPKAILSDKASPATIPNVRNMGGNLDDFADFLFAVLSNNQIDVATILLRDLKVNLAQMGNGETTTLHMAASKGYPMMVNLLIQSGGQVDRVDSEKRTALHLAADAGHGKVVAVLLKHKANPDAATPSGTPLHIAIHKNHSDVVRVIIEQGKPDIHAVDPQFGYTLLHWAALRGNKELARRLLEKGSDASAVNFDKETVLHVAVATRQVEVASLLIEQGRANMDLEDADGNTALAYAIINEDSEMIEMFRRNGREPEVLPEVEELTLSPPVPDRSRSHAFRSEGSTQSGHRRKNDNRERVNTDGDSLQRKNTKKEKEKEECTLM